MGTISTKHDKLILQVLFAVGCLFSILIFYVKPPFNYISLLCMSVGLISGLVFLQNVQHWLVRLLLLIPVFWLVVVISLAVAKVLTPYV